jgi:hypothetical protein
MKSYRINEDFSNKQLKGINMAVKALSSDYDFITGWELGEKAYEYGSVIYIDLIVDLDKVNEFYLDKGILTVQEFDDKGNPVGPPETQISDYWLKRWRKDDNQYMYFILGFSDVEGEVNRSESRNLKNELDAYYQQIPEIFATNYIFEYDGTEQEYRCELNSNEFINKPRGNVYYSKV